MAAGGTSILSAGDLSAAVCGELGAWFGAHCQDSNVEIEFRLRGVTGKVFAHLLRVHEAVDMWTVICSEDTLDYSFADGSRISVPTHTARGRGMPFRNSAVVRIKKERLYRPVGFDAIAGRSSSGMELGVCRFSCDRETPLPPLRDTAGSPLSDALPGTSHLVPGVTPGLARLQGVRRKVRRSYVYKDEIQFDFTKVTHGTTPAEALSPTAPASFEVEMEWCGQKRVPPLHAKSPEYGPYLAKRFAAKAHNLLLEALKVH